MVMVPPSSPKQIRVLIVDDEGPARMRLADLLGKDPEVGCILEAENGVSAVGMIQKHQPDLVFLDVQMPELDGFGVIEAVGANQMPLTVFVTAYDSHAIRAFEANALDYLLKPFADERHEAAMARAKARLDDRHMREFTQRVLHMVSSSAVEPCLDRLVVKSGGTTRFLRASDIDWIEAAGVYVNLHAGGKDWLYRAALSELASKLDPIRFVRIHRSAVVNIESIDRLEPASHGEFEVVLKDGSRCRVSRGYRAHLEKRLGQSL
jgi:two-component system LytT family response regulator